MVSKVKRIGLCTTLTLILSFIFLFKTQAIMGEEVLTCYNLNVKETMGVCYTNMPMSQKGYFTNNNYHIIILKEDENICDMEQYSDATDATGLIDYEDNMIYIKYFNDTELMKMNLYHELGHMLDESNNFISETDDFYFIYKEREEFFSHFSYSTKHFTSSRRECFAQMYSIYKLYPNWLSSNYGYIYNYFMILEMK